MIARVPGFSVVLLCRVVLIAELSQRSTAKWSLVAYLCHWNRPALSERKPL